MRYLTVEEVVELHRLIIEASGGAAGVRDFGAIESAAAQPRMTFGGHGLYETAAEKAACLAFSLVRNHAFVDGNKRVGHAAMETFLVLNGYEISSTVEMQEEVILRLAAGELSRADFTDWVRAHVVQRAG